MILDYQILSIPTKTITSTETSKPCEDVVQMTKQKQNYLGQTSLLLALMFKV